MSGKTQRGFTLIEMVMAIVVIGIGLGGVLLAFNTTVKASADPMVQKQMLSLAEGMMEEVLLQPYAISAAGTIDSNTCSRATADDISDYNGYGTANGCGQPRDLTGNPLPNLAGYSINVAVNRNATLGDISGGAAATITVTVNHGSESLTLVGYKTNYF